MSVKEKKKRKLDSTKILILVLACVILISVVSLSAILLVKSSEEIKDDNVKLKFEQGSKKVNLNKDSYVEAGINYNSTYEFSIKNNNNKEKDYAVALTNIKVSKKLIEKKAVQYIIYYDDFNVSAPIYTLNSDEDLIISSGKLGKNEEVKIKVILSINGENGLKKDDVKNDSFNADFDMKADKSYLKNEYVGEWSANKTIKTLDGDITLNDAMKNYLLQWNQNVTDKDVKEYANVLRLNNDGTYHITTPFSALYDGTYKVDGEKINLSNIDNKADSVDIVKENNKTFLRLKIEYLKGKEGYLYFEKTLENKKNNDIPKESVTTTTTMPITTTTALPSNIKVGSKTLEYGTYIDYVNNEKAELNKDKTFTYEDVNGDKYSGTYYTEYSSDGYGGMQYYIVLNSTVGKKIYFEVINNNHMSDQWHELIIVKN